MSAPHDPKFGSGPRGTNVRLSGSERKRLASASTGTEAIPVPAAGVVDPAVWFPHRRPVELEVGCGKGAFLVHAADMFPDVNFLGVELVGPIARVAAMRAARRELENVRVLWGDAKGLVRERLASECLDAVHVFFPDPWHKKRHRKRRVFDAPFLEGVTRTLVSGGMLCLATDHREYFQSMTDLVHASASFAPCLSYEVEGIDGVTNFERKYLAAGRKSYRASFRKR